MYKEMVWPDDFPEAMAKITEMKARTMQAIARDCAKIREPWLKRKWYAWKEFWNPSDPYEVADQIRAREERNE